MIKEIAIFSAGVMFSGLVCWRLWIRLKKKQDIHHRKLVQRARRAEKMAELGQLTGHLAHEIRNPLSIIKVNLQLMGEDVDSQIKAHDAGIIPTGFDSPEKSSKRLSRKISTITNEVERVTNTLNDFLRYAGRMELHPAEHNINEILEDLIDFIDPQAVNQNIQIRSQLYNAPIICRLDKDLIKQAFLNLFINAIQIMDQGGELMIHSRIQDGLAYVDVTDTGPGIEPDMMEKIFDPYYTTRSSGTGLGLPTCRRIVEEHDGHIELHSESGKGTCFSIELPTLNNQTN